MTAMFTPEELAEMARADAEIEASFRLTNEELECSRSLDREAVVDRMDYGRRKLAERKKAYREANLDKVAEYQKAKGRLEELEATKEELETKIACEKLAKPKVSAEFMIFWLHRFRKLDVRQKSHRKMLIDTFINAIFLYDDKMLLTFNYKEGTTTLTFNDLKAALADEKTGSDLDCSTAPEEPPKSLYLNRSSKNGQ